MGTARSGASRWIVGPRVDGLFILGVPLWATAAVLWAAEQWSSEAVWAVVMTFAAVGHHLPGFIRTYGDRTLFARFRARFIVSPVVVFCAAFVFARHNLHGVLLISLSWSIWHGMMQHFGFMRIYDAKAGNVSRTDSKLDWWLTASWFGLCLVVSPHQTGSILDGLYHSGISIVPPAVISVLRIIAIAAASITTLLYVRRMMGARQRGQAVSAQKLLLVLGTTGLVVYARTVTADPFISVALFEVLHDVQYLAIVWAFNRRTSQSSEQITAVSRMMFASGAGAALYVALCLAYGSIGFIADTALDDGTFKQVMVAALTTSGILHFYYDGFIWKLRESGVRRGLDVRPGDAPAGASSTRRRDLLHGAIFLSAVVILGVLQTSREVDEAAVAEAMAVSVPDSSTAQVNQGRALAERGQFEEAAQALLRADALQPNSVDTLTSLGDVRAAQKRHPEAIRHYERAGELAPANPAISAKLATARLAAGDLQGAADAFREAIARGGVTASAHNNLGYVLLNLGELDSAERSLGHALDLDPSHAGVRLNMGLLRSRQRRYEEAAASFRAAIERDPRLVDAHNNLGGALMMLGRPEQAEAAFERALQIDPGFQPARHNLQRLRNRGR